MSWDGEIESECPESFVLKTVLQHSLSARVLVEKCLHFSFESINDIIKDLPAHELSIFHVRNCSHHQGKGISQLHHSACQIVKQHVKPLLHTLMSQ